MRASHLATREVICTTRRKHLVHPHKPEDMLATGEMWPTRASPDHLPHSPGRDRNRERSQAAGPAGHVLAGGERNATMFAVITVTGIGWGTTLFT